MRDDRLASLIEKVDIRLHRTVFVVQNAEVSSVVSSQSRVAPRCVADDPAIISAFHPPIASICGHLDTALKTSDMQYQSSIGTTGASSRAYKNTAHGLLSTTMRGDLEVAQAVFPRWIAATVTVVFFANCDISVFSHQIAPPLFFNLFVSETIAMQVMSVLFGQLAQSLEIIIYFAM